MGLAFAMVLIFWVAVFYLYRTAYRDFKKWDVDTVTAADFTVEYSIPLKVWNRFCEMQESNKFPSKVVSFASYLKA